MNLPTRLLACLAAMALAAVATAQDAQPHPWNPPAPYDPNQCSCVEGQGACEHRLRNPNRISTDPCWCDKCRETPNKHDGNDVPFGWNRECFMSKKVELYLRRHAAAYGITCAECLADTESCSFNSATCPDCRKPGNNGKLQKDYDGRPARQTVEQRYGREKSFFPKSKELHVLYTKHFYLVTDVKSMKVPTPSGTPRVVSGHEWAHMMMARAEYARREFCRVFGEQYLDITRPTGMYIPEKRTDAREIQRVYIGNPVANILYGGSEKSTVANAFCFHGFCISMQEFGADGDDAIHLAMAHMIGHELMSCWVVADGMNRALPRWVHVGIAHWLSRLQPRFREDAFACNLEGKEMDLPGTKWDKEVARIARTAKPGDVEVLFGKSAQGQLTEDDHRRAWSYFDLCLSEWREPFVRMLYDLRRQKPVRDAFMAHLKCTPEIFDERWRERVLGKRKSMDPAADEATAQDNEPPGVRERKALEREKDPTTLAALVRGLGTVDDPETAKVLVDLFDRNSELIRETVMVALLGVKDPAVLDAAWRHGLAHSSPMPRAFAARLCREHAIKEATPQIRELLGDGNWYARAEAALALGSFGDVESLSSLVTLVDDSADKTRVAAMDALGMLGESATPAVGAVSKHLSDSHWQLRVTAAQSLGAIGSMEGVEPLIARMEIETGRLTKECREALKLITRDDLGRKAQYWRAWWEKLKDSVPGGALPARPAPKERPLGPDGEPLPDAGGVVEGPPKEDPDARYAQPEYFGIELYTSKIGFVLDTSGSMELKFRPDPEQAKKLGRTFRGGDKITICKEEIAYALKSLDPRAHFNLISFGTEVDIWKRNPVPANPQNVESGIAYIRNLKSAGETNIYGALRAVLDLGDAPDSSPGFRDTPDTLTFLTDGMPTAGEITDPDVLLAWYTNLNRYARVTTHIIALGTKGLDRDFFRGLAERNNGTFLHIK